MRQQSTPRRGVATNVFTADASGGTGDITVTVYSGQLIPLVVREAAVAALWAIDQAWPVTTNETEPT